MSNRSRDPAALRPRERRSDLGYWPTPSDLSHVAIRYMLPHLPLLPIWECAAGDGCVAEDMRAAGHIVLASDIKPRGPGIERRDFLHDDVPESGLLGLTNPPYEDNLLTSFITRGLQHLDCGKLAGFVLLLRWDHVQADERADAINRAFRVQLCSWRPTWIPNSKGNGRWAFAWVAWLPGHPGPPTLHTLKQSELLQVGLPLDASAARRQWSGPNNGAGLLPEQELLQGVWPFAQHQQRRDAS